MGQLKDWIRERQSSRLFGRTRELQLMRESLVDPREDWSLLHFCGLAGAGKTALLRHFERITADALVIYMSDETGFDTPQLFLRQLAQRLLDKSLIEAPIPATEATDAVNRIAETTGRVVMLLDDLDQWLAIEEWLQTEWLPSLSMKVRVCSTGRAPLVNVRPPLYEELIVNEPLLSYVPSPPLRKETDESTEYLEAASILKTFDHQLLERILNAELTAGQFEELCRSPHVIRTEYGWYVADELRRKLRTQLKVQFPVKYMIYKQRAEFALNDRLRQLAPEHRWPEHEQAWRKFSLLDNDFLQGIVFCGDDQGFSTRPAQASELPALEQMLAYNIDTLLPYKIDEVRMHSYITKIWQVDPQAVRVVHRNGKLAGLYFLIPLNEETRAVLSSNPITQSFIDLGTVERDDYFVYTVSSLPAFDFAIFGYILRKLLFTESAGRRMTFLLPMLDQVEAFRLIGFEHLEWAKFHSIGGLIMYFTQLDLRAPIPLPGLYSEQGTQFERSGGSLAIFTDDRVNAVQPDGDLKAWESLVKHLLDNYKDIQSPKIREVIMQAYRRLKSGTGAEQTQAQILQHRYLQKKGSHESTASLLFLPIATYYRHLRRMIVTIAHALRTEFFREMEEK